MIRLLHLRIRDRINVDSELSRYRDEINGAIRARLWCQGEAYQAGGLTGHFEAPLDGGRMPRIPSRRLIREAISDLIMSFVSNRFF